MFTFKVNKNNIKMIESETVTSGSVNVYDCQFIFSEEWEGLSKTVAFKAGDVAVASILNDSNTCKIPWEVLKIDGADLFVGVKGAAGTETEVTDDDVILPTVWAYIGIIRKGATDGTDPLPPSPSVYEQIIIELRKLEDGKQNKLTAGEGVEISADNVISCTVVPYDDSAIRGELATQGETITAQGATINAQGEAIRANSKAIADNSDAINRLNNDINTKQNKITGVKGQIVGFDDNGNPIAQDYTGGTTYTAGEGIEISADNVISSTVKPYDDTAIRGELTTQGEAIRANSEAIAGNTEAINRLNNDINTKQNKITGVKGQIVGFDDNGEPVAQDGGAGEPGKDGVTFIPTVSSEGVISWSNDGGLVNPDPVNIKGAPGNPGANGTTFTPTVSSEGVISWTNDGGLDNPDPVNIKGKQGDPGTPGDNGVTFTPTVSGEGVISWTNDGGLANPDPVNIKGAPGDPGSPGANGTTFTPTVSSDGVISWSNDGELVNPDPVNIKGPTGPAGTYTAGAGIEITNDTIGLKNTASTKYNRGTANITGIGGFDFTLTSQTSSIISLTEYLKTSPSGEGSTVFKTRCGYANIKISARRSATLSTAKALRIVMSDSVNMTGAAGFARITIGEGSVTSENIYLALVYADSDYLYAYPTQTISIAQGGTLSIDLYVH